MQSPSGGAPASRTRFELEMLTVYGDLCARALALTKDRDAAADLVQQACERGLRAKSSLGDGTNAGAWLKCVIRNLFIDEYRSRQKEAPLLSDMAAESIESGPPAIADILTIDEVKQEIQAMPQADRVILVLALFEDCSYREISTRLGILPKTVGTRLFRAKAKLRKRMHWVYERRLAALTRLP
jgi:RNA polymerase sigma-70 factor (ECF subfamily)